MVINRLKKQSGTTLMELLVVISIIGIMTGIMVISVRQTDTEELKAVAERVVADFKQIRNLAASHVINEDNEYPAGGYGIYFDDSTTPSEYIIFADDGQNPGYQDTEDSMINKVLFSDDDLTIKPIPGNYNIQFYFTFITEHTANTDIPYADHAAGSIEIENASSDKAIISVYDLIDPSFIWGNISVEYEQ